MKYTQEHHIEVIVSSIRCQYDTEGRHKDMSEEIEAIHNLWMEHLDWVKSVKETLGDYVPKNYKLPEIIVASMHGLYFFYDSIQIKEDPFMSSASYTFPKVAKEHGYEIDLYIYEVSEYNYTFDVEAPF
jgi:hypothetical protein